MVDLVNSEPLEEGRVGEVCVHSPALMNFYFDSPDEEGLVRLPLSKGVTGGGLQKAPLGEETFLAFRRTGDLGFIWERELFVVGRKKETLKVHGRAVAPEAVEEAALAAAGAFFKELASDQTQKKSSSPNFALSHPVRRAAAFSLETKHGEEVGLALEIAEKGTSAESLQRVPTPSLKNAFLLPKFTFNSKGLLR